MYAEFGVVSCLSSQSKRSLTASYRVLMSAPTSVSRFQRRPAYHKYATQTSLTGRAILYTIINTESHHAEPFSPLIGLIPQHRACLFDATSPTSASFMKAHLCQRYPFLPRIAT